MLTIIIGICLGVWITMGLALIERYKMSDYLWIVFIIVTVILGFLGSFRLILKYISKVNPRLYIWINEITSSTLITAEYRAKASSQKDKPAKKSGKYEL